MKKIMFFICLALITSGVLAQKDPTRIQTVNTMKVMTATISKQETSNQLTKIEALLTKLEADLRKIDAQLDKMRDNKDSLSELGEQQQLKMQMIMDRMTKADQAASNAMKKFSEMAGNIIGNMK